MKLRIKGDSIRLRVTQGELASFASTGAVEDRIRFGAQHALVYRLARDPRASSLSARFEGSTILVGVPEADARRWCESNEVTLAATQSREGAELRIVVEKDFACLAPREGEDESDNFPHPQGGTGATC
jgi:hypothetical protein